MNSGPGEDLCGILNLNKPAGPTSHDVVLQVRRLSGQKRVGHAGTLDPQASGVLLLCLGQATRVAEYLMQSPKVYRATIRLGISTTTYDAEGEIRRQLPVPAFSGEEMEKALAPFVGRIAQKPPLYSALRYKGKRLYKWAREGAQIEPQPRPVEIEYIKVLRWDSPSLTVEVRCSPGTYIRSLAHDLGEALGCGAHLSALTRLASGHFTLEEAITLEELAAAFAAGRGRELLYPMEEALLSYRAMTVDRRGERQLRYRQQVAGPPPSAAELASSPSPLRRAYSEEGDFIALVSYDRRTKLWQPRKVFTPKNAGN